MSKKVNIRIIYHFFIILKNTKKIIGEFLNKMYFKESFQEKHFKNLHHYVWIFPALNL